MYTHNTAVPTEVLTLRSEVTPLVCNLLARDSSEIQKSISSWLSAPSSYERLPDVILNLQYKPAVLEHKVELLRPSIPHGMIPKLPECKSRLGCHACEVGMRSAGINTRTSTTIYWYRLNCNDRRRYRVNEFILTVPCSRLACSRRVPHHPSDQCYPKRADQMSFVHCGLETKSESSGHTFSTISKYQHRLWEMTK